MPTAEINLLAVLVAGALSMAVGFVWYSLGVFGKPWMKETGLTMKEVGEGPGTGYALAFAAALAQAYVLAHAVDYTNAVSWTDGLATGFWVWFGFVATAIGVNYIFTKKSLKLWSIDVGYFLVLLLLQGALLAVWR